MIDQAGRAINANALRRIAALSGYMPSVPTPFNDDGAVDHAAFERFCDWQIEQGAAALVICGTTGEAPVLSATEYGDLVESAVGVSGGRVPVIVGAGSNSTSVAIDASRMAEALGADALLSVVPYYNKPNQAGLYAHFRAIADATGLPIILHDIPARTVTGLGDETIIRLAESPQIIGLEDSTGDVTRPARLRRHVGPSFRLFSGDDATALPFLIQGGDGCISVTSNIVPTLCKEMFLAFREERMALAKEVALNLSRLTVALSTEPDPVPVKYVLSRLGFMSPRVRLPMVELTDISKELVAQAIARVSNGMIGGSKAAEAWTLGRHVPRSGGAPASVAP